MAATSIQGPTSSNVFVNALQWGGWRWDDGAAPGTEITYAFGTDGFTITPTASFGATADWQPYQMEAYARALQSWANVANITFAEVPFTGLTFDDANFVEFLYFNSASNILGFHQTPDPQIQLDSDGLAAGAYNAAGPGWTVSGLKDGGFALSVIVHEIGHALGLSHPHDTGGGSTRFPGVASNSPGDLGDNDLNQGIFTVMSYNDGWTELGSSPSANYGWSAGPMAADIAAIQALYGANDDYRTGNDTYVLRHTGGDGDALVAIWDAGGTDSIIYGGKFGATIDLRAATLENAPGGGGFVSYASGAPSTHLDHWKAFTIANGVIIENAKGGAGADWISGNAADNTLRGAGASDKLIGRGGDDVLIGGPGGDNLSGGSGEDVFVFSSLSQSRPGNHDQIHNFKRGEDIIDLESIDAKTGVPGDSAFKWTGKNDFHDKKGELHYQDLGSKVLVEGDVNGDGKPDFAVFPGSGNGGYGKHDLNQGIFTTMSYNDGWDTGIGLSPSNNYGWQSGPMAFDIAAIQDLYGPNTDHHKGNNSYILRHVNGQPDDLLCIWDAGGTDTIVYGGHFDSVIDLRAATLQGEPGGGGFVSYVKGAPSSHRDHWNAFTIANGVVIEKAKGGGGADWINGNGADNALEGAGGNDKLIGRGGDDVLMGGLVKTGSPAALGKMRSISIRCRTANPTTPATSSISSGARTKSTWSRSTRKTACPAIRRSCGSGSRTSATKRASATKTSARRSSWRATSMATAIPISPFW